MSEYKLTLLYKKGLDHKTRNFILLIIVLIITIAFSVTLTGNLKNRYTELNVEKAELRADLDRLVQQTERAEPLKEELNRLKEELFLTDKIIPSRNNPTTTLAYLFDVFKTYNNYLNFDFRHQASGHAPEDQELFYNRYAINGEENINRLFVFIDQFERQPALFTIESIDLASTDVEEQGKVNYSIEFNGYYTETGVPPEQIELKNLARRTIPYNIFYPRIHRPFVAEEDLELPDVDDLVIIGMTSDQLFVRDAKTAKVTSLETGDKVRYGSLHSIDWENQEAVFSISRTGLRELIRLEVNSKQ